MTARASQNAHNVAVMREISREVKANMGAGPAWAHGFVVGLALAERFPATAIRLRGEIERMVGDADQMTPEQAEVHIRNLVDMFDRSADQEPAEVQS